MYELTAQNLAAHALADILQPEAVNGEDLMKVTRPIFWPPAGNGAETRWHVRRPSTMHAAPVMPSMRMHASFWRKERRVARFSLFL